VNALKSLPPDLLQEVQRHFSGGYLWMGQEPALEDRNRLIRQQRSCGWTVADLAGRFRLTPRQVRRVLRSDMECES